MKIVPLIALFALAGCNSAAVQMPPHAELAHRCGWWAEVWKTPDGRLFYIEFGGATGGPTRVSPVAAGETPEEICK